MPVIGTFGGFIFSWHTPDDASIASIEIWASSTNDRAGAILVQAVPVVRNQWQVAFRFGLGPSETYYFWIRPRGRNGFPGAFQPANPLGGISATTAAGTLITSTKLRTGSVSFGAGDTTQAVTLDPDEADTSYQITLGANTNKAFWWSAKATTGFTINKSTSGETSIVDWMTLRV